MRGIELPPSLVRSEKPPLSDFGYGSGYELHNPGHWSDGLDPIWELLQETEAFVENTREEYVSQKGSARAKALNELRRLEQVNNELRKGIPTIERSNVITAQQFTDRKLSELNTLFSAATSINGDYPFYQMESFTLQKYRELVTRPSPASLKNFHTSLEAVFRSAMELNLAYETVYALNHEMIPLNHAMDISEGALRRDESAWIDSLIFRLNSVDNQRVVAFRLLPPFLQREISPNPTAPDLRSLVEKLQAYRNVFDNAAHLHRLRITPYAYHDPNILGPLSAPEVDALRIFIDEQPFRPPFQDYYRALFHQETANHLSQLSAHYASLQARAQDLTQQYLDACAAREARIIAMQQAAYTAHIEAQQREKKAAEAEYALRQHQATQLAAALSQPAAMNIAMPAGVAAISASTGNLSSALAQSTLSGLAAAIRSAITALGTSIIASSGALFSGLVIGGVALLWPSSIAPGDRRASLMLPLAHVSGQSDALVDGPIVSGQTLALPYAVNLRTTGTGVDISVVAAPRGTPFQVPVIDLHLNPETGAYQAIATTTPTVITITPIVKPGNASTELPATQPVPAIMQGPDITLNNIDGHITPAFEALDVDIFILRYPAHTGLPSVYLAVQKPPVEIGEVGRYKDLAARSKKDGIDIDHIPSQKALTNSLKMHDSTATGRNLKVAMQNAGSIAIPSTVHQQLSETYGARNSPQKSSKDAANLRLAIGSNLSAYAPALRDLGITQERLHEIELELQKLVYVPGE